LRRIANSEPTVNGRYLALAENEKGEEEVYRFILREIDSVPHLEALLLLWNSRPGSWTREQLAERLYVMPTLAQALAQDLVRQHFAVSAEENSQPRYSYDPSSEETNRLVALVDAAYRREVVRISTLIHSKPSSSLRDFAQAFRFTKERE
jgi:hypothetical protein